MNKRVEQQMTEWGELYAKIEGGLFKIGHILDTTKYLSRGGRRVDSDPFLVIECWENEDPARLFAIWKKRLQKPVEPIMGNETVGLPGDRTYTVPTCPTCGEVTYSHPRCPFCGQMFTGDTGFKVEPGAMNYGHKEAAS